MIIFSVLVVHKITIAFAFAAQELEVPPYVPQPQILMLGGLFQFEDSLWQTATVWGAGGVVLSIPVWLWLARNDTGNQLLAVQVFFDVLRRAFPTVFRITFAAVHGTRP